MFSSGALQSGIPALGTDLRDLLRLFDEHGVKFLVVGGFAVAVHGAPRYTKDLDLWLERSPDNAARVLAALGDFGFASLGLTSDDFLAPDTLIQLGYEPNRVDLLTDLTGVEFAAAYPKRVAATVDGVIVPVIDRDSLVANKRAFGRPRDLLDADEIDR